jgi:hypothetical protein
MSTKYTYAISTSFPNHRVDSNRLTEEINDSEIQTELDYISTYLDDCAIWFASDLSGTDKAILDGIVAVHSGEPVLPPVVFGDAYKFANDDSASKTTSMRYQEKLSLETGELLFGNYRISWSYECMGSSRGKFLARVQMDSEITLFEVDEEIPASSGWQPSSGFTTLWVPAGKHKVSLGYCTDQKQGVAHIRRARIDIMGIGE